MSFREFEYSDAKSFKFWKIDLQGTNVVTKYGRIGTDGQETMKGFGSAADAQKAYDKLVAEKLGKGYVETTKGEGKPAAKAEAAKPAKAAAAKSAPEKAKPGKSKDAPAGNASAAKTGRREFHFISGSSSKFWAIELKGKAFDVTFGRLGTAGTTQTKEFASEQVAQQNYDKLVQEKTSKGYSEVGAASAEGAAPADGGGGGELSPMMFNTTRNGQFELMSVFVGERVTEYRPGKSTKGKSVFRIRVSYDDEGSDDEQSYEDRLSSFLASDAASATKGLILGAYDLEGGSTGLDWFGALVKSKDRLPNLKALFLGDILQEECEISWIQTSDVSPILAAFPNLEMLRLRGATGLEFSQPQHASLRALAIESGGLSAKVVAQICRGKFPELEYLELWLGTPDYDGDCRVNDLQPILKGKLFPKLKYLGLRNAQIADDIAGVIATSPVVDQLETLDLSLGNLSDEGGNALLQLESKNLKRLDLHHHYMSKALQKKLKALPFPVDVSEAKSAEDAEDEGGRFISVSE